MEDWLDGGLYELINANQSHRTCPRHSIIIPYGCRPSTLMLMLLTLILGMRIIVLSIISTDRLFILTTVIVSVRLGWHILEISQEKHVGTAQIKAAM